MPPPRPTRAQLLAAKDRTVPDLIAKNLHVLFCGINPGLYTAYFGHHFAGPGNRFWPTLYAAGFTPRLLTAFDEPELLPLGYGITNLVDRPTATAAELAPADYAAAARTLLAKVKRYRPRCLAVLGIGAYRLAFAQPAAQLGPQPERLADTRLWILPNPSGLNAHYQPKQLAKLFREMRETIEIST